MAEKIKLNKNTLRDQNQSLKLYLEFLPTLELRKQQLQAEVRGTRHRIEQRTNELTSMLAAAASFAPLLASTLPRVRPLVAIEAVETRQGNVAGVKVPVFERARFRDVPYSLIATPLVYDAAIAFWRGALAIRSELAVLAEQLRLLDEQLTKTTQRINLYEKVLIPECREHIRKIKVYLGDQQTAGVCRAKIAKGKLVRVAERSAATARGE